MTSKGCENKNLVSFLCFSFLVTSFSKQLLINPGSGDLVFEVLHFITSAFQLMHNNEGSLSSVPNIFNILSWGITILTLSKY